jgi:hypothetical protein
MDGQRPELADPERLDALVGTDETAECLDIEPAVGVGHISPGGAVDAGESCEVARRDLWQPAVVAAREVISNLPELLVDDVEVVEEPLLGERDLALRPDSLNDAVVCGQKDAPVVADSGKKISPSGKLLRDAISRRQALGVLLQALDAKELGANGFFHARISIDRAA